MASNTSALRSRYAPFTCIVKVIDPEYNTLVCESNGKVSSPRYPGGEVLCFSVGHLDALNFKVGDRIKQGQLLGRDGKKQTNAIHSHWSFGVGPLKLPNYLTKQGTFKLDGKVKTIYALSCMIGWIHSYDFWFVPKSTPITTDASNPAFSYPWKRLP